MDADAERYGRDVYDHLIRISDLVDSYRDLLTGAMDTCLSTVSNRLNVVIFAGAGIGLEVLAVVGLLSRFRRRGWL